MTDSSLWYLAKKEGADGLSLQRLFDVGPEFSFRKYSEKFSVIWSYSGKDSSGAPSDSESTKMEDFENAVCSAMETAHEAVLVIVFTAPTHREFVWHARGKSSFLKALNRIEGLAEDLPIAVHHETDKNGELYFSYASKMVERLRNGQNVKQSKSWVRKLFDS